MAPNHGHETDNYTIYDHKTRFMGFFQGIFIKFTINPDKWLTHWVTKYKALF